MGMAIAAASPTLVLQNSRMVLRALARERRVAADRRRGRLGARAVGQVHRPDAELPHPNAHGPEVQDLQLRGGAPRHQGIRERRAGCRPAARPAAPGSGAALNTRPAHGHRMPRVGQSSTATRSPAAGPTDSR
jgi:hypothetical protein